MLRLTVKWVLFLGVLAFVGWELYRRFSKVEWERMDFRPGWAAAALAFTCLSAGWLVINTRAVLASLHATIGWRAMLGITWFPRLGKYVPGKAASVVGAIWLLRRRGVPLAAATSTILVRTATVTTVSFMLAAPITLWPPVRAELPVAWLWCLLLIAAGVAFLHPRVFEVAANFALRILKRPPLTKLPRLRDYLAPVLASVGQWASLGLALYCVVRAVTPGYPPANIPLLISAASLGAGLGFVALFAPAGLGVLEFVLLAVLPAAGLKDEAGVAIIVVLMRLVMIITDVTLGLFGLAVFPQAREKPPNE